MSADERMMRRALALASLGRGSTSPNPLVGAVVVRSGRVEGQGYHARAGEPHAETIALRQAGRRARGATLYTNLEPCCHTGRTPPCVLEINRAGVTQVVSAMRDPDPRVNGGGFRELRRHGIAVEVGLLKDEAMRLNASFYKFIRNGLPFVTLKGAVSWDGRIATRTGDSKWISSREAREHARLLRRESDAVMVGIGTVLADDPSLTARPANARLVRLIMDTHLRLPLRAKLVREIDQGPVVVFAGPDAPRSKEQELRQRGVEVRRMPLRSGKPDLSRCLRYLAECGVTRVLVEGGGELHASFVEQKLADRLVLYLAPRLIGGREARPLLGGRGADLMKDVVVVGRHRSYRVGDEIVIDADLTGTGSKRKAPMAAIGSRRLAEA